MEATGPRPSDATIDAALEAYPDMRAHVRSLESEGVSPADARHEAYPVVAREFLAEVQQLSGYISGPWRVRFEAALYEPTRVCLVQVPPDLPCDAEVVAAAEEEADWQGEVITGGTESPEAAEAVRRSHLGLDLAESEDKAQQEGRPWRVVAEDGVQHVVTSDLQPGRLNVTACRGVVVEPLVEGVEN